MQRHVRLLAATSAALSIFCAEVGAAGLEISKAAVEGGRLVLEGKASAPRQVVRIVGTGLRTRADAKRNFAFSVSQIASRCVVGVATSGATASAVVENCAEAVLAGERGPRGPRGFRGPMGKTGATGKKGATGATGPRGLQGATGATGPRGLQGATGPTGSFSGKIMFVVVNADASILRSNPSTGFVVSDLGTGQYEIDFPSDVDQCAVAATIGFGGGLIDAVASKDLSSAQAANEVIVNPRTNQVSALNTTPALADRPFQIVASCP